MIDIPQGLLLLSLFSNILFGYVQMNALQAHDVFQFISKSLQNAIWLNFKSVFSVKLYFFLFPVFPLFLVVFFSFLCHLCVYVCILSVFIYANKNTKTKKKIFPMS